MSEPSIKVNFADPPSWVGHYVWYRESYFYGHLEDCGRSILKDRWEKGKTYGRIKKWVKGRAKSKNFAISFMDKTEFWMDDTCYEHICIFDEEVVAAKFSFQHGHTPDVACNHAETCHLFLKVVKKEKGEEGVAEGKQSGPSSPPPVVVVSHANASVASPPVNPVVASPTADPPVAVGVHADPTLPPENANPDVVEVNPVAVPASQTCHASSPPQPVASECSLETALLAVAGWKKNGQAITPLSVRTRSGRKFAPAPSVVKKCKKPVKLFSDAPAAKVGRQATPPTDVAVATVTGMGTAPVVNVGLTVPGLPAVEKGLGRGGRVERVQRQSKRKMETLKEVSTEEEATPLRRRTRVSKEIATPESKTVPPGVI